MHSLDESRIFKNEEILSTEYLPELLPHREQQTKLLVDNLSPASKKRKPINTFLFGGPGIGKTACAKYVFREFENYSGIKTIYLNCWDFNTSVAILSRLTNELGAFVQRRGWAKDEILDRLIESLKKSNKGLVICLDEIDQLVYKDPKALYDLLRINQYVDIPVGLVFISNDPWVFANLEPRIKSSLALEEIEFKSYSMQEIKDILQERTKYAFHRIDDVVILLAANHAIQKGSDVRVGLECLLKAGRVAEQENSDKVKIEHIKKILKEVKEVKPQLIKENVNGTEKNILEILDNEEKLTFVDLYKKYCSIAENPVTERTFRDYLDHLMQLKMIEFRKRKIGRSKVIAKV
jgi:cell division control protein 6